MFSTFWVYQGRGKGCDDWISDGRPSVVGLHRTRKDRGWGKKMGKIREYH